MTKPGLKKWMYDFILSICLLVAVAACLVYSYILESPRVKLFLARPDTYMALWLFLLAILCLMLMKRALVAKKTAEGQQEGAPIWSKLGIFTIVVLFFYLLLLEPLGFILSSFMTMWCMTGAYTYDLNAKKVNYRDRKILTLMLIKTGVFSFVSSYLTYWIFTSVLSATLPTFSLL